MSLEGRSPEDDIKENEKIRYRIMLESVYKFRFFVVGLIFAILSFAMQFPVKINHLYFFKLFEIGAWILLVIAGFYAIRDCGGFAKKMTEKVVEGLEPRQRSIMWKCFFLAIVFLLIVNIAGIFDHAPKSRSHFKRSKINIEKIK